MLTLRNASRAGLILLGAIALTTFGAVNTADAHGLRRAALYGGGCCDPCCEMVTTVVNVCHPCSCCTTCVKLCIPKCCVDECPQVFSRRTLFGCGLVRYTWCCCGYSATIRFDRCGGYRVIYRG